MARVSRSKQPAFDPNELNDLIFSPAVGTGVGSHLLATQSQRFPAPGDPKAEEHAPFALDVSTMATSISGRGTGLPLGRTIAEPLEALRASIVEVSTVVMSDPNLMDRSGATLDMSTVTLLYEPTVGMLHSDRPLGVIGVKTSNLATGDTSLPPTVDMSTVITPAHSKAVALWITEQGDLIPQGRVKRIRLAQDVINAAEESVYDTLWTTKAVQSDERDSSKVVQAGYGYLVKRTRLARKTIQRIVAKLIDKDFIAIECPADIYQRSSTVYRVFSYKAVLERHLQRGRTHVAKVGPGFSYVSLIPVPQLTPPGSDLTTVAISNVSTMARSDTVTVAEISLSTVVRETTSSIDSKLLEQKTSSSLIYQALSKYGSVDDDVLTRLLIGCKKQAADCTEDEIIHFIHEKGVLVKGRDSRIYSPIGFLVTAVPRCFAGDAFRLYRESERKRHQEETDQEARRHAELEEWGREQEARLADTNVPEADKELIRKWLGLH